MNKPKPRPTYKMPKLDVIYEDLSLKIGPSITVTAKDHPSSEKANTLKKIGSAIKSSSKAKKKKS